MEKEFQGMVSRRSILWGITSTKVINIIGRKVALEMMKKSDSIGSTLTRHCGSMKTKSKTVSKKQKIVKGVAKIMIVTRIHWKLMIGTMDIFLKKKTALTKSLDQSNKRVYAEQMELKWVIVESVLRDSIINGGAKWNAEVHHNAVRCGVLLGNHEERHSHKVA